MFFVALNIDCTSTKRIKYSSMITDSAAHDHDYLGSTKENSHIL